MSLGLPLRKSNSRSGSYRTVIMCVAAVSVLLARSAPVTFPRIYAGSTFTSLADRDHRLCFDNEGIQREVFVRTAPIPPPAASPHVSLGIEPSIEIGTDGWHYN